MESNFWTSLEYWEFLCISNRTMMENQVAHLRPWEQLPSPESPLLLSFLLWTVCSFLLMLHSNQSIKYLIFRALDTKDNTSLLLIRAPISDLPELWAQPFPGHWEAGDTHTHLPVTRLPEKCQLSYPIWKATRRKKKIKVVLVLLPLVVFEK